MSAPPRRHPDARHLGSPTVRTATAASRVVRLAQVAGDVGVGHAHRCAAGEQRPVLERLVVAADVGRIGELDVLARQQQLHRAGLQTDQRRPVLILLGAVLAHDVVRAGPGDEAREHRRDLLPVELGIVVLVEQPEPDHRRRHPRHAADLPLGDRVEHVQDLVGRHPHRLAGPALTDVARVGAMEVVGDPAPIRSSSMPKMISLPFGRVSHLPSGRCSEESICSCNGTARPSSGRRGRNPKKHSPTSNMARAAMAC